LPKRLDKWLQNGFIPKDAGFSRNMSNILRRGSPQERWLLNVLALPAKGGDTIFFKLSSGAIKSRSRKSDLDDLARPDRMRERLAYARATATQKINASRRR
jgi:hypothetical protein